MRLKRIKLAGFKSFVEPTTIPFPDSMTAVVGPNGCGKSNVIDAVRWVLGESSAKNLRGDAMTDVIFNGSSSRKPVGQCSVELVFENAQSRLSGEYAKYAELSVKRVVTRDAQSNYFLNGTKCRRRDVTDLFLGTGLGPRSYAIIEQGMISRLIESKPQELRVFIEEAAGISKYKERRRETETRIRHTSENLERLEDVRSELGQQLAKLERQAAAAQRYTKLKARERTLKSELALMRFMALQQKLEAQQQAIKRYDDEYALLKAELDSDEAGAEKYRAEQTRLKLEIDTLQQDIFQLATQITRIEEAAQYKSQRLNTLQRDEQNLRVKHDELQSKLLHANEQKSLVDSALEDLLPEQAMLEEQLAQASDLRDEAEEALQAYNKERRNSDEAYHSKKRQAQTQHSQIQSTMSMQMRTQQRIKELSEELKQLDDPYLISQRDSLTEQLELTSAQREEALLAIDDAKQVTEEREKRVAESRTALEQINEQLLTVTAKLNALSALQVDQANEQDSLPPLWQSLEVTKGYEACVELVLSHLSDPRILATNQTLNDSEQAAAKGQRIFLASSFTTFKVPETLASKLLNSDVPAMFNHIFVVSTDGEAMNRLSSLKNGDTVLSLEGAWLSQEWQIFGASEQSNGALQRRADIAECDALKAQLEDKKAHSDQAHSSLQQQLDEATRLLNTHKTALQHAEASMSDVQQKLGLVTMQLEQNDARRDKTKQELAQQQDLLEQEHEQLERLSEQVEILEAEILELEIQQQDADERAESLQNAVSNARQQREALTQKTHSQSMLCQQKSSELSQVEREISRLHEQKDEVIEHAELVKQEILELQAPEQDQQEQLQQWLQQKQQKGEEKVDLNKRLVDAETMLQEAQQGQQGARAILEQKQKERESLLLEAEGLKARSASILEQLQETGNTIKDTMETLPDEANEAKWEQELEQITASVKRLGAVNLAAVDEYKIQAERKAHLDEQNDDLTTALETLESAIRKIDRETRSRFSQTFEQVNDDLKALFPKVFGGGSAYLALTDDDLLETGVTIMARPPGKKNSTIHLLSGGEKALTALSLVFAIFRLNPAPFCLLDEVDAPLDDANVGRFCKLVSEMSETVQFIYITHNKIAMEMATHLTGVTMAEPGVSRMVAVDVEEAVTLAQA